MNEETEPADSDLLSPKRKRAIMFLPLSLFVRLLAKNLMDWRTDFTETLIK